MGRGTDGGGDWFGQPRGLTILFLTETWEKFSYYGMRAILIYYMTKQLLFSQQHASLVYGLYTGCAYLCPLIGAPISDRWLGRRRAVVIGGVIMAAGHFMMAFDNLLYPALATIAIGNGLYLPNLPAQIEPLYAANDPRAKNAINVYYVGINLGAFIAPLACGTLGEFYGWHYGFALAGVGMVVGLVIYLLGQRYLPEQRPVPRHASQRKLLDASGWQRLRLLVAITLVVVVLRAGYEQVGNTLPLWADLHVDRSVAGLTIPMTWFMSLNPLIVFAATPPLVSYWNARAARGRESSTSRKMSLGAALIGAGYFILATGAALADNDRAGLGWLLAYFIVMTLGELLILPVGLGLVIRIAPAGWGATAVAIWFSTAFLGSFASGLLGGLWSVLTPASFFALVGALCLAPAAALRMFERSIKTAEDEVRDRKETSVRGVSNAGT